MNIVNYIQKIQMEVQSQNSNNRKTKVYQMIHSNCEFLTVVRNSSSDQRLGNLPTLKDYENSLGSIKINGQNFIQTFIQTAYLIFTCRYYNKYPLINPEDVRIEENFYISTEKKFSVIIYYQIIEQSKINSYISIVDELFKYLFAFYEECEKSNVSPLDLKNVMQTFKQQYTFITTHLSNLQSQKQYFTCLEETSLFRDNSTLLQIKKSSILDLIKSNFVETFKEFKKRDIECVKGYHNEKNKIKTRNQELKKIEKKTQMNIMEFFQFIQKSYPERCKFQVEEDQNNKDKVVFIFSMEDMPTESFTSRLKKSSPVFGNLMFEEEIEQPKQEKTFLKFQIEYSSERNSIYVRLLLNLNNINNETNDLLMYQANTLTFDTANVSIEIIESKPDFAKNPQQTNNLRKQRYLAYKVVSCYTEKEAPLQKILIFMDLAMISSKIYQPFFNLQKSPLVIALEYEQLSIVHRKVNHFTKIFLRCARKIYNE